MSIAVVVDLTSDIPDNIRQQLEITEVPLLIMFGNEQFRDGIDISNDEFYARLTEGNIHPTSSQPSAGDFAEVYERLGKDHEGIISIHLGGKLSGTVRSAQQAADMVPNVPVRVVDSGQRLDGSGLPGDRSGARWPSRQITRRDRHGDRGDGPRVLCSGPS